MISWARRSVHFRGTRPTRRRMRKMCVSSGKTSVWQAERGGQATGLGPMAGKLGGEAGAWGGAEEVRGEREDFRGAGEEERAGDGLGADAAKLRKIVNRRFGR